MVQPVSALRPYKTQEQTLIYYPNFEPPSDTWVKFAMLYLEHFKTIVPYYKRHLLSDTFIKISNETDLVSLYEPRDQEGYRASLKSIDLAKSILSNQYERSELFGKINLKRVWTDSANWTYLIYKEKFSFNWADFCIDNNIGLKTDDGLLLSEELAFIFMTYLAKEIAFQESAGIITDNSRFDNFTNYSETIHPTDSKKNEFAKGIINHL